MINITFKFENILMFVENYFQYTIFIHTFLIFSLYQYLSVVIRFNNKNNLVKNTYIIYKINQNLIYLKLIFINKCFSN